MSFEEVLRETKQTAGYQAAINGYNIPSPHFPLRFYAGMERVALKNTYALAYENVRTQPIILVWPDPNSWMYSTDAHSTAYGFLYNHNASSQK